MSENEDKGFTVVDRRGVEDEEPAAAPAAQAQTPAEPQTAAGPQAAAEAPHEHAAASPGFDFAMLVQSFAITAMHDLGLVADPASGQRAERNLPLARQNIEILELLERKTRGNLDDAESRLLSSLLYELRMHFVEATKSAGG